MSFTGTVENGTIRVPPEIAMPDGTRVVVEAQELVQAAPHEDTPFAERYADLIGIWDGPSDLAAQHDHYASGAPKRDA
jgi:hypothetical protein